MDHTYYSRIPIIKLWHLLLVPLQGELTDELAGQLTNEVLEQIHKFGSSGLVIDITGLWLVDSHLCAVLSQLSSAASLMGASTFISGMKQRGWGRVVSMGSSTFGSVTTGFVHYISSKGGIMGFTRALASEFGPHGITVNAIAPSLTRTPGALARKPRAGIASIDEEFELVAQGQAIRRVEVPDDIVGTVSYLTSDDAAFVTGQMINVNGGRIFS